MTKKILLFSLLLLLLSSCNSGKRSVQKEHYPIVDSLLRVMTLEEKVGQLVLLTSDWTVTGPSIREGYENDIKEGKCGNIFNAYTPSYTRKLQELAVNETRLGIPLLFGYDVIHGFKTIFPINLGMAASWDPQAIEESARVAAREAAAAGLHWTFSPMCDICVEPRWGRVSEGSGEDPYLGSQMSAAMTRGYQGEDLSDPLSIAACVKHFAAYGAPQAGRDYNTVDMSERWLREFYLPPYKAAIDEGAVSVMASFNEYDGTPATANHHLLTEILRDEWGFNGFVVSDYTGVLEMLNHGNVATPEEATVAAINAGNDMDMQSSFYYEHLLNAVNKGLVSKKTLNEAVRRVLRVKAQLGLFEDPFRYCSEERFETQTMTAQNLETALKLAEESSVLLKNDGVLPIAKGTKVAVIGELATRADDMLGTWRGAGESTNMESILDAIKKFNGASNVLYAKGCSPESNDRSGFAEAITIAKKAQKVILVIGENCNWSGEAASRANIDVPAVQTELLEKIVAMGKPVVVVLMSGRPITLERESKLANAIMEVWFPGTMGGRAVTNLLFGEVNPSGRLPITFPVTLGQVPIYHYAKNTGRPYVNPGAKYESRYLDTPNEPLYAFGEGLSYTTFEYSDITLNKTTFNKATDITATISVTNTGEREGIETVQMYIRDLVGSVTRPVKQLKGFERVSLKPGETKTVSFTITPQSISFWRKNMTFAPEEGDFELFIGHSSNETKTTKFTYTK